MPNYIHVSTAPPTTPPRDFRPSGHRRGPSRRILHGAMIHDHPRGELAVAGLPSPDVPTATGTPLPTADAAGGAAGATRGLGRTGP